MFYPFVRFLHLCFVLSSLFTLTANSIQAQLADGSTDNRSIDDDNAKKQRLELELRRLRQIQNSKVELLEAKVRNRAMSLNSNMKEVSALRDSIRSAVRIFNIQNYALISTSGFNNLANQLILSLPTYSSFNFAMYEIAEMKNMQGRLRLQKGAFENLNRQYVREALELERLNLLQEFLQAGQPVTVEMLARPKSFLTREEQDALAGLNEDGNEKITGIQKGRIMFGTPKAGDNVTPKSKSIYLLKNESDAETLMLKPSSYSETRLLSLAQNNSAAKFDPGQHAVVLIEGEHLLKIQIDDPESSGHNFVGWVSKDRVVRYREKNVDPDDQAKNNSREKTMLQEMEDEDLIDKRIEIKPKKPVIVKMAGMPAIGSQVTPKSKAIGWKTSYSIKDYLKGKKDRAIIERSNLKGDVAVLDENEYGRVVAMEIFDNYLIFQVIIESTNSSLKNSKWWVSIDQIVVCNIK